MPHVPRGSAQALLRISFTLGPRLMSTRPSRTLPFPRRRETMTTHTVPPTAAFKSNTCPFQSHSLAKVSHTTNPDANGIEKYNLPLRRNDKYLGPTFQSSIIVLSVNVQLWERPHMEPEVGWGPHLTSWVRNIITGLGLRMSEPKQPHPHPFSPRSPILLRAEGTHIVWRSRV